MNNKSTISYFYGSFGFTFVAIAICYMIGGVEGAFQAFILALLETSMSMDNAVVNSSILKKMSPFGQKLFLTVGMIIAVFFMRLLFPVVIVWMSSTLTFVQSAILPFHDPKAYEQTLTAAHVSIAGFGGTFLLMVFFSFFLDEEKESHWIPFIEPLLQKAAGLEAIKAMFSLVIVGVVTMLLPSEDKSQFIQAGVWGIIAYMAVEHVGSLVESVNPGDHDPVNIDASWKDLLSPTRVWEIVKLLKVELAMLFYLEMVDASFSFDGVIGAFAVSNDAVVIALGLGAGAMFVRSLTLLLVDKNTIATFRYLEHGAFWSIGVLAGCMFVGIVVDIPEYVSGVAAAVIIGISVAHSVYANRQDLVEVLE